MRNSVKLSKNINNIYNFKNPIRHFLNFSNIDYVVNELLEQPIENLCWTKPFVFMQRKYYKTDEIRTLRLPNVLNFFNLYLKLREMDNFDSIEKISNGKHSRIKVNLDTGDFASFNYQHDLSRDLIHLNEYDCLVKLDIASFYNTIYTHRLVTYTPLINDDKFITNMNSGSTGGILMGSYLSLYLAEFLLAKISETFKEELNKNNIENVLKYFSDDFYIFCDKKEVSKIKDIFTTVLYRFHLTPNDKKKEVFDYEKYNEINIIDRYWLTIINNQKSINKKIDDENKKNKTNKKYNLYFINQLIYRKKLIDFDKTTIYKSSKY